MGDENGDESGYLLRTSSLLREIIINSNSQILRRTTPGLVYCSPLI
jgi:hypothetical protein